MTKLSFEMFDFVFPSSSSGSNCWNIPNTFSSCSWIQSYSWKWQKYWKQHVQNTVNGLNSAKEYQLFVLCDQPGTIPGDMGIMHYTLIRDKKHVQNKDTMKIVYTRYTKFFFIKMCKSFQDNLPTIACFPNTANTFCPTPTMASFPHWILITLASRTPGHHSQTHWTFGNSNLSMCQKNYCMKGISTPSTYPDTIRFHTFPSSLGQLRWLFLCFATFFESIFVFIVLG